MYSIGDFQHYYSEEQNWRKQIYEKSNAYFDGDPGVDYSRRFTDRVINRPRGAPNGTASSCCLTGLLDYYL